MSTQSEDAILNVKINGQAAISTFQQLNKLRQEQINLVKNLNENTPQYAEQAKKLQQLNAQYAVWKQQIYGVSEANKGLFSDWKKGFEEVQRIAAGVTIGTLISRGVRSALDAIDELISGSEDAYKEAVKTQTQLQSVIKSTGGVAGESRKALEGFQKTLMDQTGVDDDVIAKGEEMLLTFTNVRGTIYEKALPAIVDMTAAMNQGSVSMEGIQATAIQVGKALNDPINGLTSLKKVGVTFTEQQKEQIKAMQDGNNMMGAQKIILAELNKEFGGTAKALSSTDVGKAQAYATMLGNISENIGKWILSGKSLIADFLTPFLKYIEQLTSTKLSETLEDERNKMRNLGLQITDTNTSEQDRITLIKQLKSEYPDLLKNLDAEKASNKDVADAVNNLNEKYINRIILAKKDEEIEKQNQSTAELRMKQLQAEDDLRTQINKLHDKFPEFKIPDGTAYEKLLALVNQFKSMPNQPLFSHGGVFDPTYYASQALNNYEAYLDQVQQSTNFGDKLLAARNKLKKELGIDDKFTGVDDGKPKPVQAPTSGPSAADLAAIEAKKKRIAELLQMQQDLTYDLNKLNDKELSDTKSTYDKELDAAAQKYNDLIKKEQDYQQKIRLSKDLTPGQKKKAIATSNNQISEINSDKDDALDNLRIKQAKETTEAIAKYQDEQTVNFSGNLDKQIQKNNEFYDGLRKNLASGDLDGLLNVEANRIISNQKSTNDAQLSQEQKFQEEMQQLRDEYNSITDDKGLSKLAQIQKQYDKELAMFKDQLNKKLIDQKQYDELVAELNKKNDAQVAQEKKEEQKQELEAEVSAAQTIANAGFTIAQNNRNSDLDAQTAKLESQRAKELNNINLTASQKAAINNKYDKQEAQLKQKKWKADQSASIKQALIAGALGAIKLWIDPGFPEAIPLAIALAAETAASIGIIAAQKPPQFASGGILPTGASHSAGGLNVTDALGNLVANIEGGEPIISKKAARANPNLVNALLGSQGKTVNYEKVITAANTSRTRIPVYATPTATGASTPGSEGGHQFTPAHFDRMEAMYNKALALITISDQKKVVLSNRLVQDNDDKMAQITNSVNG